MWGAMKMSIRTKKVKSTGKFGPRYGVKVRKRILEIEKLPDKYTCPHCSYDTLVRKSSGVWYCKKCGKTIASSAYLYAMPTAIHKEIEEVSVKEESVEKEVKGEAEHV